LKIEDASPFLLANAVARRSRQLIMGAPAAPVPVTNRRPVAIALAEFRAGAMDIFDPSEAVALLADDAEPEPMSEEEYAAAEANFGEIFEDQEGDFAG